MNTPNLSLIIHGVTAVAVIASSTVLAITLKTIPADVATLYGVVLGVAGANGAHAVRAVTVDRTAKQSPPPVPPMQGGVVQ